MAASEPAVFHDVTVATSGVTNCSVNTPSMCNNSIPAPTGLSGGQAGYPVTVGYDEVTGLGSLDVQLFVNNFAAPTLSGFTITPTTVTSGGTASLAFTLSAPAPTGGAIISLTSSNGSAFPVVSTYTIQAGQTTATVGYAAGTVTSATMVTITASYNGSSKQATVTVNPATASITLSGFTITPATVTSGGTASLTLTLSAPAPTGGAIISLTSSNGSAFPVVSTYTIPVGQTTATVGDAAGTVTSATAVTITASYNGSTQQATVTVNPAAASTTLSGFTIAPTTIISGGTATLTLTLSAPAPTGGAIINLTSSNGSAFPVVSTYMIQAGQTAGTFGDAAGTVTSATAVTITASYNGSSKQATVTVNPAAPSATLIGFTITPTVVTSGGTASLTFTLSGPAPTGGATLSLTSSNSAVFPVASTFTIAAGQTTGSLTAPVGTAVSSTTIIISASYNSSSREAQIIVNPTVVAAGTITLTPTSLIFLSQMVDSSSSAQSVVLSNTGSAALNPPTTSITGANSGDFATTNNCQSGVNGGNSCSIQVTFTPTAAGTRTATLSVTDSNAGNSPQTVALSGSGTSSGAAPSYTLASSATSVTVAAGNSTSVTLNLASTDYAGTVSFAARVSSSNGTASNVSASAPSATLTSGGNGSSTLTITATTSAATHGPALPWKSGGAILIAALLGVPFTLRRKQALAMLLTALTISMAVYLTACGGGSASKSTPPPSRSYTVTVTPTGTSTVTNPAALNITVTVQ